MWENKSSTYSLVIHAGFFFWFINVEYMFNFVQGTWV